MKLGNISLPNLSYTFQKISSFKAIPLNLNLNWSAKSKGTEPCSKGSLCFSYFCLINTLIRVGYQTVQFLRLQDLSSDHGSLDFLFIISFLIAGIFHLEILKRRVEFRQFVEMFLNCCKMVEAESDSNLLSESKPVPKPNCKRDGTGKLILSFVTALVGIRIVLLQSI
jgi:hypothetical protein